jgi:hypothetical protein
VQLFARCCYHGAHVGSFKRCSTRVLIRTTYVHQCTFVLEYVHVRAMVLLNSAVGRETAPLRRPWRLHSIFGFFIAALAALAAASRLVLVSSASAFAAVRVAATAVAMSRSAAVSSPAWAAIARAGFLPADIATWTPSHVLSYVGDHLKLPRVRAALESKIHVNSFDEVDGALLFRKGFDSILLGHGMRASDSAFKVAIDRWNSDLARSREWSFEKLLGDASPSRMTTSQSQSSASRQEQLQLLQPETPEQPEQPQEAAAVSLPLSVLRDRILGLGTALFAGDSLGLVSHWYYDPNLLIHEVGEIRGYRDVPVHHGGNTIMSRHWRENKHGIRDLADLALTDSGASALLVTVITECCVWGLLPFEFCGQWLRRVTYTACGRGSFAPRTFADCLAPSSTVAPPSFPPSAGQRQVGSIGPHRTATTMQDCQPGPTPSTCKYPAC